jgi:hypothetical protein
MYAFRIVDMLQEFLYPFIVQFLGNSSVCASHFIFCYSYEPAYAYLIPEKFPQASG